MIKLNARPAMLHLQTVHLVIQPQQYHSFKAINVSLSVMLDTFQLTSSAKNAQHLAQLAKSLKLNVHHASLALYMGLLALVNVLMVQWHQAKDAWDVIQNV